MANTPFQRQAGTSSFAFNLPHAPQSSPSSSGAYNGARVSGGDSVAGVERATPMTFAQPGDDHIPDFIRSAMEPYIQRRQQQAMVKGAADYQRGKTLSDIAKSDSGIAGIFGPSAYHQGASLFAATDAWARKKVEITSNPELESMSPGDTDKYLADQFSSVMTGDTVADQVINGQIMQDQGPLVAAISAKQAAYAQNVARTNTGNTYFNGGEALKQTRNGLDLSSPSGQAAYKQAEDAYVSNLVVKPFGMGAEAHQEVVADALNSSLHGGNVAPYEAFVARGGSNMLTGDQQTRLETAYNTAASKVLADAQWDERLYGPMSGLDMMLRTGGYTDQTTGKWVEAKGPDIAAYAGKINDAAAKITGITSRKLITGDDLKGMLGRFNEGVFSAGLRLQDHQWQLDKDQRDQAFQLQRDQAKDAMGIQQATSYAAVGSLDTAVSMGFVEEKNANLVMGGLFARGDYKSLDKNFTNSGKANTFVASQLQAGLKNATGVGLTAGAQRSIAAWTSMDKINPAMASAYAGEFAPRLERYQSAVAAGSPDKEAWAVAFETPGSPDSGGLPNGITDKSMRSSVHSAVTANDSKFWGWFGGNRTPLADSSQSALEAWLYPRAKARAQSGIGADRAAQLELSDGLRSGTVERAGPFVWFNRQPTKALGDYVHVPSDAMDKLVTSVADAKLKAAGYEAGANGHGYTAFRTSDGNGPALIIHAPGPDGSPDIIAHITAADLVAANRRDASTSLTEGARSPALRPKLDFTQYKSKARKKEDAENFRTDPDKDIGPAVLGVIDAVNTATPAGVAVKAVHGVYDAFHDGIDISGRLGDKPKKK